jgi:hypothetical protein
MSNFISGMAVVLSTMALLVGGFSAYQVFTLQEKINDLSNKVGETANQASTTTPQTQISPVESPSPSVNDSEVNSNTEIQSGQYVQKAFGTKAEVELLNVKRIKDPEAGTFDVVNVQMRVRRLASDNVSITNDAFYLGNTTARNPDTNETYKVVDAIKRSTGSVSLFDMRPGSSVDAYVWLRVPEGTNSINLYIPKTAAFQNIPISN